MLLPEAAHVASGERLRSSPLLCCAAFLPGLTPAGAGYRTMLPLDKQNGSCFKSCILKAISPELGNSLAGSGAAVGFPGQRLTSRWASKARKDSPNFLSPPAEISISTPLRGIWRIPGRDQAPERGHKKQLKPRLAPLAVPPHGRQKAEPAKHFIKQAIKQAIIKQAIWCTEEDIMPGMLHAPKTLHSNCGVFNPHNVQLEGPSE